ncbi:MAG: hypothetical protein ABI844_17990 [Saprospiraceae bacterium]
MEYRITTTCLFSLCFTLIGFSQNHDLSIYGSDISDHLLIKQRDLFGRINPAEIDGSPYLNDSFISGKVYTHNLLYSGVKMRYNIYGDYVEFKDKEVTLILDPKPEISKVEINNEVLLVQPYDNKGNIKLGYFVALDTGAILLLKKRVIIFKESVPAQALQDRATPAKYVPAKDIFYYRTKQEAAKPIYNLKKIMVDFPDHKKDLLSMISRRKLKENEEDLKLLWEYYNKLKAKE